tara:strand:+ start:631 stop:1569 length:939 start_codon:yes stop_codon:yes gene_type:complete
MIRDKFFVDEKMHGIRLDIAITQYLERKYSRNQIKNFILDGCVQVNDENCKPKDKLVTGDEIEFDFNDHHDSSWMPEKINFSVKDETSEYIIVEKSPNLIMHPGAGNEQGTLANGLLFRFPELAKLPRSGIVHRLDKDTSGLVLVAKTNDFRNHIVSEFQNRNVKKFYHALIKGNIVGQTIINEPILRDRRNRLRMTVDRSGREAISIVKNIETFHSYSLVEVEILTGRTHQIRVHMDFHKTPIVGDKVYGSRSKLAKNLTKEKIDFIQQFPRQALHASKLSFALKNNSEYVSYQSDLPKDIKDLINVLKKA